MIIHLIGKNKVGISEMVEVAEKVGFKHISLDEINKHVSEGFFVVDDKNAKSVFVDKTMYVMRPFYFPEEHLRKMESTRRTECDYVFINDGSLHKLRRKSEMFFDGLLVGQKPSTITRNELVNIANKLNGDTGAMATFMGCSRDKIVWWATKYCIHLERNTYSYWRDAFLEPSAQAAYWAGILSADGCVKKHLKYDYVLDLTMNDKECVYGFRDYLKTNKPIYSRPHYIGKNIKYEFSISSPYLIEDLKSWGIEPRKSRVNKVPEIIRDNDKLLRYWLIGLIDGDGSICCPKIGGVFISVLASEEIVDFCRDKFSDIDPKKYQEKNIEGLYSLRFFGKKAVELYRRIGCEQFGLSRKWDKVRKFMFKKWHH